MKKKLSIFFSLLGSSDLVRSPRTIDKMERSAMVTLAWMKVTHVWSFDELHIIAQFFNVLLLLILARSLSPCVLCFQCFLFLDWFYAHMRLHKIMTADSQLKHGWQNIGFISLMMWIPSEDYTNPSNRRWHTVALTHAPCRWQHWNV